MNAFLPLLRAGLRAARRAACRRRSPGSARSLAPARPAIPPVPVPRTGAARPAAPRRSAAPVSAALGPLLALLLSLPAPAPAADGALPRVQLTPAQVQALGLGTQPLQAVAAATARYPGRVLLPPSQQRVVAAPLAGLLLAQPVAVGSRVRAGQVLARLHSPVARELQREQQQAESQSALAARSLAREEALLAEGLIPAARLEASRVAAQQAAALAAERRRAVAEAGATAGGELALRSPIDGVVMAVLAEVGQRVEAATPLLRVARLSPLWVELAVPVARVTGLQAAALRVQVDPAEAGGEPLVGRVLALGDAVDPASQTVLLRAELQPGPGRVLRPGQQLELTLEQPAGADPAGGPGGLLQLDSAAVLRHGGQSVVFVQEAAGPGHYRLQPVQVRGSAGGLSQLAPQAGLAPGQAVVVRGTAALLALLP